jgi:hypothetical protein
MSLPPSQSSGRTVLRSDDSPRSTTPPIRSRRQTSGSKRDRAVGAAGRCAETLSTGSDVSSFSDSTRIDFDQGDRRNPFFLAAALIFGHNSPLTRRHVEAGSASSLLLHVLLPHYGLFDGSRSSSAGGSDQGARRQAFRCHGQLHERRLPRRAAHSQGGARAGRSAEMSGLSQVRRRNSASVQSPDCADARVHPLS